MTAPDIITNRLIIRSTQEKDGELCLSIWLDDEMGKYLADPPRSKASENYLNFAKGIENDEGWYPFVAFLKSGEFLGTCSVVPVSGEHWDLGYCVHKDYWRQGYATEMITDLIDFCIDRGGKIFTAKVAQDNPGSNAVLKKLGFEVVGEGSFLKKGTDITYKDYTYQLRLASASI